MLFQSSINLLLHSMCAISFIACQLEERLNASEKKVSDVQFIFIALWKSSQENKTENCVALPMKLLSNKYTPSLFSGGSRTWCSSPPGMEILSAFTRGEQILCINVKLWERDFNLIQLITKSTWNTLYMSMRKAVSTAERFNQLWETTAAGHEPPRVPRLYWDGPS